MSSSYMAKDSLVQNRQLKVLSLSIPLSITANATPASKTLSNDEPALLFMRTEDVDQITLANGAVDSQAELDAIVFQTESDSAGKFSVLLRFNEALVKVVSAKCSQRTGGTECIAGSLTSSPATGITSSGQSVVLDFDSGVNFATTSYDACLEVSVQVEQ